MMLNARGLAAMLIAAMVLGGCAAGGAPRAAPAGPPPGDLKDRVTASDETDASKRATVRMELAMAYFGRGQMTTALDQVKLAISADPSVQGAYNLRGLIYANLGDDKLAEESFRYAIRLDPHDADAMHNFGYFLCQKKRYPEANDLFDQALVVPQYRERGRTLLAKGVCYAFAGQLPESETTLLRAYELDPTNPSTAVNLSEVLYRRGEYERARFYIRRVTSNPALISPQTLWLGARIENKLGNRRGVQDIGDQLVGRFPNSREASSYQRGKFDE